MFIRCSCPGQLRQSIALKLGTVLLGLNLAWLSAAAEPESASEAAHLSEIATSTQVLDLNSLVGLDDLMGRIAEKDVIFIGESHNSYADHLNQLAIIERLHARGKPLAIGMEFFQQPFQPVLDAYVAGELSEHEMLKQTEYFDRWRYDYRLYRPILRFAREQGIALVALNLPRELTEKVGKQGMDALEPEERARLPAEIDASDPAYRERLKAVYEQHPQGPDSDFERFLSVQLLWDEGMAEQAARFLDTQPGTTLVVLAGSGHLEYDQGIPMRLKRRKPVETVTILNGTHHAFAPERADYLLFPLPLELPARGLLGVMLDTQAEGEGVRIEGFSDQSGARDAGVKEDDRLVRIGGRAISDYADVRIAMVDAAPGDQLAVEVLRPGLIGKSERLRMEVRLH
ncbi:putative iron-regulated protein [Thiorhodovibrio winogradskyi]|uniref:Iron-regulated protein n=1 Tax=Thiorhodovibrio winogradskyi TaxID=77007 RepID=A0ABZ0SC31_9GAMM|nr:ChaN family lipoprotein [Thiorhodovibrio winogradskyi]